MAGNLIVYDKFKFLLGKKLVDLSVDAVNVVLLANGYTFDFTHTAYADLTNEVANGHGYLTGGQALANQTWTESGRTSTFDADDSRWDASGGTIGPFRKAALVLQTTVASIVKPLLGCIVLDANDQNIGDGNFFVINWNASGILTESGADS